MDIRMSDNMSHKLYTAKDIQRYLGVDSNTLYHWVQTKGIISPEEEGIGRGKAQKFSLENLASIYLAKVLYNYGVELARIKKLFDSWIPPAKYNPFFSKMAYSGLWALVGQSRNVDKKERLYLVWACGGDAPGRIDIPKRSGEYDFYVMGTKGVKEIFTKMAKKSPMGKYVAVFCIDLTEIVSNLETVSGDKIS
jgi:hypothetical protein